MFLLIWFEFSEPPQRFKTILLMSYNGKDVSMIQTCHIDIRMSERVMHLCFNSSDLFHCSIPLSSLLVDVRWNYQRMSILAMCTYLRNKLHSRRYLRAHYGWEHSPIRIFLFDFTISEKWCPLQCIAQYCFSSFEHETYLERLPSSSKHCMLQAVDTKKCASCVIMEVDGMSIGFGLIVFVMREV